MDDDLFKAAEYALITFNSTQQALRAESILERKGFNFILVPTPRELAAGCGLSLKFWSRDIGQAKEILVAEGVVTEKGFLVDLDAVEGKFKEL